MAISIGVYGEGSGDGNGNSDRDGASNSIVDDKGGVERSGAILQSICRRAKLLQTTAGR